MPCAQGPGARVERGSQGAVCEAGGGGRARRGTHTLVGRVSLHVRLVERVRNRQRKHKRDGQVAADVRGGHPEIVRRLEQARTDPAIPRDLDDPIAGVFVAHAVHKHDVAP
eukprot:scaffold23811_cov120-Isochrysis_galbana.AAC.3